MSKLAAYEIVPSSHLRVIATLSTGQRIELEVRLVVLGVIEHDKTITLANGVTIPHVDLQFNPVIDVHVLEPAAAPVTPPQIVPVPGNLN